VGESFFRSTLNNLKGTIHHNGTNLNRHIGYIYYIFEYEDYEATFALGVKRCGVDAID
jgi:hypothetical protein